MDTQEWEAPIVGDSTNVKVVDNPSPGALQVGKAHSQVSNFPKIQIQ
jgi:hypothetical protein